MKRSLLIAAFTALVTAKPELYKETEDFQYARSSTDEGSKSGFYGAQRGNMGGNYERAHNMDGLAQHQMSGLVRQVEGELGDGFNQRSGKVYTSAQSGGIYGAGKYDVSNLQGRNFEEGGNYDSHSSLSSHNSAYTGQSDSSLHNSAYNSQSRNSAYSGYQSTKSHGQLHAGNLQSDVHDAAGTYGYGHDSAQGMSRTSQSAGHHSQTGYHAQSEYDSGNTNQHSSTYGVNPQSRLIAATPVRIYGRPGQRIAVPVGAQIYDASHASAIDQNAIGSEAELLSNTDQHVNYRPAGRGKYYESSYNYQKQWEKHGTNPEGVALSVPTENPFPNKNSELYADSQSQTINHQVHASELDSHTAHSSNAYNYDANSQASSLSHSRQRSGSAGQHNAISNAYTKGGYNSGSLVDGSNVLGIADSTPKSYQSSYSYHKAWERQGDPYVIQPVADGSTNQESQRLTALSNNNAYTSHKYGTHYAQGHTSQIECDENGHARVARSTQAQNYEDQGQQTQKQWERLKDVRQQTQNDFENLRQQTQNNWENLGQQTQNNWENLRQPNQGKWNDKLEEYGQQSHKQRDRLEDLGQQTRNNWENLGQQTQEKWDQFRDGQRQTEMGQQTQEAWNNNGFKVEDYVEQAQHHDGHWINDLDQRREFQYLWDLTHLQPQQENTFVESQSPSQSLFQASHTYNNGNQQVYYNHNSNNAIRSHTQNFNREYVNQNEGQQTQSSWNLKVNRSNTDQERVRSDLDQFDRVDKINSNNQNSVTFGSLWDKINVFEEPNIIRNNTKEVNSHAYSSNESAQQSLWNNWGQINQSESNNSFTQSKLFSSNENNTNNSDSFHNIHKNNLDSTEFSLQISSRPWQVASTATSFTATPSATILSTTTISTTTSSIISTPTATSTPAYRTHSTEEISLSDIGRGDIGPEETIPEDTNNFPKQKTPEEIESLSMKIEEEKNKTINETHNETQFVDKISVLMNILKDQSQQTQNFDEQLAFPSNFGSNSSDTEKQIELSDLMNTNTSDQNNQSKINQAAQVAINMEQQSQDQAFMEFDNKSFEQQGTNFEQETGNFEQETGNFEEIEHFEQQTGDFEQQAGDFNQNTDFGQQSLPQNFEQPSYFELMNEHFGKNNRSYEQRTGSFDNYNLTSENQNKHFGKSTENINQHFRNLEQTGNFIKQNDHSTFKTENNIQQNSNLEKESRNLNDKSDHKLHSDMNIDKSYNIQSSSFDDTELTQQSDSVWGQDIQEFMYNSPLPPNVLDQYAGHNKYQDFERRQQPPPELQITERVFNKQSLYLQQNDPVISNTEHRTALDERKENHTSISYSTPKTAINENIEIPLTISERDLETFQKIKDSIKSEKIEDTGFWKSVGSKLGSVKNKVASWFQAR